MTMYVIVFGLITFVSIGSYWIGHAAGAKTVFETIQVAYQLEPEQVWDDFEAALEDLNNEEES